MPTTGAMRAPQPKNETRKKFDRTETNDQHLSACKLELMDCDRCKALHVQAKQCQTLPILHQGTKVEVDDIPESKRHLALKTWFQVKVGEQGQCMVACMVCQLAGRGHKRSYEIFRHFSDSLVKTSNLKRHHDNEVHKMNALKFLEVDVSSGDVVVSSAPPARDFEEVAKHFKAGNSLDVGVASVGQSKKLRKMGFCLAESLRILDKKFANDAVVSSLRRDESQGRLVVRFTMVNHKMNIRSGTIGVARNFGTGATALTQATIDLINVFASTPSRAPPGTHGVAPVLDNKLMKHCKDVKHQVIID